MNEFEQAEAALAAMRQADYETQQAVIAEAAAEAEDEARLVAQAERDLDEDTSPAFNNIRLQDRLDELDAASAGYVSTEPPTYVAGHDPFDNNDDVTVNTITITSTDGTTQSWTPNEGLLNLALAQPTTELTPVTEQDIRDVVENITLSSSEDNGDVAWLEIAEDEPTVEVKTEKIKSSAYDTPSFLTIERIKTELMPILEDLYPDKWDWTSRDKIIIHFPAFTISNSRNERHDIKDLYVKLSYNHANKTFDGNYTGARMSITKSELNGAYAHSHLPSISNDSVGSFNGFCLGRSTLSYLLSDLATIEMTEDKLEDIKLKFMLVLMEVENYLQWESVEGGPYRYMKDINSGKLNTMMTSKTHKASDSILESIWMDIIAGSYKPQLKFNHKGLLKVIKNDGFLQQVSKYCHVNYLTYRDGTGKFFSERREDQQPLGKIDNGKHLKFKGKTLYPQLIDEVIIYEESGREFAHPQIVDRCKAVIQESINQSWGEELAGKIITHYLSRERKVKNTRKNLFTNLKDVRDSIST